MSQLNGCISADYKLLVVGGISNEGFTNTSEIFDLEQSWDEFNELPTMMDTPMVGYLNPKIPLVCGKFILKD